MKKKYIVCNVDGSVRQKRFLIHREFSRALAEATRLAGEFPDQRFMIMETVGGFVSTGGRVTPVEVQGE